MESATFQQTAPPPTKPQVYPDTDEWVSTYGWGKEAYEVTETREVWRAECERHGTQRFYESHSHVADTTDFCEPCAEEYRRWLASLRLNPGSEWSRTDQEMERAERAEEDYFRGLEE